MYYDENEELYHYGTKRHSGRYPYGSGGNPNQHSGDFISRVHDLERQGLSEKEIAKAVDLPNTTELRLKKAAANHELRRWDVAAAEAMRGDGKTLSEIADKLGYPNESSIRSLLNKDSKTRMDQARNTADALKDIVDKKGFVDVGAGVEREIGSGVSRTKFDEALYLLDLEGYPTYGKREAQTTNPGQYTTLKILCPPGSQKGDVFHNPINSVSDYISTTDGGETYHPSFVYPKSMDSKRLAINYREDGGLEKDGVIELRRGQPDLDLGEAHYAQVRILVDNDRYLKGMAMYSDKMPDGVDVVFNTNKSKSVPKMEVLKAIHKEDPNNPFGSLIKEKGGQSYYTDKDGKQQLSLINKRAEEGDWGGWSDRLPSQFLSKQNQRLIDTQLKLSIADKAAEMDEINSITNPTIKKLMLNKFAEECDKTAVHLDAAALPRQKYQVILPIKSLKDEEIYAPQYKDGETVYLIRFPHGGTFEIPKLKVNNKQPEAKSVLGNAIDAVGINSKVAERLSGADFDGDTVMVIPSNPKFKITSTPALEGLKGFDPKMDYGTTKVGNDYINQYGMKIRPMKNTQKEMGVISNLITDMTLKGATDEELARAVRHSMVVIDAEKHHLDYKDSEKQNGINELKQSYQQHNDGSEKYGGASTLLSKSKSQEIVDKRVGSPRVDRNTGELSYKTVHEEYPVTKKRIDPVTGKTVINAKTGKPIYDPVMKRNKETGELEQEIAVRTIKSTKMAETKDANDLVSEFRSSQELAYAEYANSMKTMANEARRISSNVGNLKYDSKAAETYAPEVSSLNAKLNTSLKNRPRERQANIIANSKVKAMQQDNPDMTPEQLRKARQQAIVEARNTVGATRTPIPITDREWAAIQAGAITENTLTQILNNTDTDALRQRATPRTTTVLSEAKINRIKALENSGRTTSEIAEALGVSRSTVNSYLNGKEG